MPDPIQPIKNPLNPPQVDSQTLGLLKGRIVSIESDEASLSKLLLHEEEAMLKSLKHQFGARIYEDQGIASVIQKAEKALEAKDIETVATHLDSLRATLDTL